MNYQHLTAADRGVIEGLLHQHCTLKEIADKLGVDRSTVSREIQKRSTPNGYRARIAQLNYESHRQKCRRKRKMNYSLRQKYIFAMLELGWSPEQTAGRLKLMGSPMYVCKETIYRFIYEDSYAKEEKLYQYLRYGRKKRKKHTGRKVHRSKIPNRVSIHDRPAIVSLRTELGHWESDSVIYPYKRAINTLNELVTGIVRLTKLERKTTHLTVTAINQRLQAEKAETLTVDNGTEFTDHERITAVTGTKVFFADPYTAWQRGANENCNMLLRGYLPKRHNITDLEQEELDDIADELNNRPRKRLGYLTPNEVYRYYQLHNQLPKMPNVALGSRM